MREFATVAEIADEIRRRLETRQAESAAVGAAGGNQTAEQVQPELLRSAPSIEHDRKVYRLSDLLGFEGATYIIHLYRSLAKCQPDDTILRSHLEALEQERSTPLEILFTVAHSREANQAGTIVLGIDDIIGSNRMETAAPPVPPVDYDKLHYTVGELLAVPENAFIRHFYRCLLKRDPDPEGAAVYSGRLHSGDFITDIIHDISRAPEALGKGVQVSGLRRAALRRRLSALPVVGRLFAIVADLAHLPELARQCRALQRRPLPDKTEITIQSLRAEVSALVARSNQSVPVEMPNREETAAKWASLEQKVNSDRLTQQELAQKLESRASLDHLTQLERSKADRAEITGALLEQTRRINNIEQSQVEIERKHQANLQKAHDTLTEQSRRIDHIEERKDHEASVSSQQESLRDALDKSTNRQQEALVAIRAYKLRILDIERRLALVLEEARKRLPAPMEEPQIRAIVAHLDGIEAAQYTDFEDIFRGTREDIKHRQAVYLPYFERVPRFGASFPILDIGCGRGEFLELLYEHGHEATGVDGNPIMIERCREFGLQVERADAVDFLRSAKSGQYAVITAFHIVEHMPHFRLLSLLDEALRALRPGGLLILETPNPQNLVVGASSFYLDPTHLNPIPPGLLRFVVEARGFVNAEIKPMHPVPECDRPSGVEIPNYLAELLYGPQDYAVVACKA